MLPPLPLAFHVPFMDQSFVILVIGLLLFGKRLPEVGRSLGKGIVEFKKGIKGIEDEIETATTVPAAPARSTLPAQRLADPQTTAYKFDPHTGQPVQPPKAKFDPYTGQPIDTQVVDAEVVDAGRTHAPA